MAVTILNKVQCRTCALWFATVDEFSRCSHCYKLPFTTHSNFIPKKEAPELKKEVEELLQLNKKLANENKQLLKRISDLDTNRAGNMKHTTYEKPAKHDRHIFLYAKGHYEKSDVVTDIKKIFQERSGIHHSFINLAEVALVLTEIAFSFISSSHQFRDFLSKYIRYIEINKVETEITLPNISLVETCLSVIRFCQKDEIDFELGEADPDILPPI